MNPSRRDPGVLYSRTSNETTRVIQVDGTSHAWINKIDADTSLGIELLGHELDAGGSYFWSDNLSGFSIGVDVRMDF